MLRFLAILVLIGVLVPGPGSYGNHAGAPDAGSGSVLTSLYTHIAGHGSGETKSGTPSHHCIHAACSQNLATSGISSEFSMEGRHTLLLRVDDQDPRSMILERDPPIPRFLI